MEIVLAVISMTTTILVNIGTQTLLKVLRNGCVKSMKERGSAAKLASPMLWNDKLECQILSYTDNET